MNATLRSPSQKSTYRVSYGNGDDEEMPVGTTVGEARGQLADHLGIPPNATPLVDGKPAKDSDVPPRGATLEFTKEAGTKG